jgi:squalene synthase HpnC
MPRRTADVERAYAACDALARSHYENFPVASRLLPARMRPHVAAVYAFARIADDIADEGSAPAGERLDALAAWRVRLHDRVDAGDDRDAVAASDDRDSLVIAATAHSIRELALPLALFDDLLSAFGQDTMTSRYDSWADVFDYCRRSANPVGRLVLRIAGIHDEALDRSSDALCTALQLTNFWQDFGRDYRGGRIYVPREVQDRCGARESDLADDTMTPAWKHALRECVDVTAREFEKGRAVCDGVRGRLRLELRVTWLGGLSILRRVVREHDLLHQRPALSGIDAPALLWRAFVWTDSAGALA